MNVSVRLREQARNLGQKTAVTVNDASVDFATLDRLTDRLALRLKKSGISKGDTVAVTLPNSLEFVVAYFAVLRLGAVFMGLDPRLTVEEIKGLFADARPRAWIADDRVINEGLSGHFGVSTIPCPVGSAFLEPLDGAPDLAIEDAPMDEEDPAILLYTSGSTGRPKGVLLPARAFGIFPEFCENLFGERLASQVFGVSIPMCHIGGPIYCNLLALHGVPLVIAEPFRPDRFLLAIQKHRITGFHSVPPILAALLQTQLKMRFELPSLFWIAPMGMSVPVSLMEMLSKAFPGVYIVQGYGLTETAGAIACLSLQDTRRKLGSFGKLMVSHCKLEIQGSDGKELPPGEVGEIAVFGRCLMLGYLNRPELNAKVFRNGFFMTGDAGCKDNEGFFYHLGRLDDVINVGGEKIYPAEIEQVLYRHPKVKECCVLGVDDPKKGKSIKAFISPIAGHCFTKREILGFLRESLASYKLPQEVIFVESLPKTPVGKVAKEALLKVALDSSALT